MRKPSFLLKPSAYKTDKLYAIIPSDGNGDMTVSGYVGNGTRVNPDGFIESVATDTPRVDYLGSPGVLLEPTRINQGLASAAISGAPWTGTITATANDTVSPDGGKNADKLADTSVTVAQVIKQLVTITTNTALHTISIFVKFGDRSSFDVEFDDALNTPTFVQCNEDGSTSVISGAGVTDSGSVQYPNGWKRFWFVFDMNNAGASIDFHIYPASSQDVDLTGYHWFWGFQLEEGGYPTSYIPTSGSAVTRTKDTLTLSTFTTKGFMSITNGSFFVDFYHPTSANPDNTNAFVQLGTTNGYLLVRSQNNGTNPFYLDIDNTDGSNNTFNGTSNRARVLFNLFGDTTEVWINGTKVIQTGVDMSLTNETMTLDGDGMPIKIYEVAMFERTLNDTESKAITQ